MDLISRQAAIDVIGKIFPADPMRNDYTQGIAWGAALAKEYIKQMPSAQLEKETCKDCKWEYAFGYGECHHCKRRFEDMWEAKDNE